MNAKTIPLSRLSRTKALKAKEKKQHDKLIQKKNEYLQQKYGITYDQYQLILLRQNNVCAMPGCNQDFAGGYRKYLDHDHQNHRVRGILCYRCNHRLLGRGLEIPELHLGAYYYLTSEFDGRTITG